VTLSGAPRDRDILVTRTVRCRQHSDPPAGIHVFGCGVTAPPRSPCPCAGADRCVVVEAARAGFGWWQCADVLVCPPQSDLSAALLATDSALGSLPGCTLAVASFRPAGPAGPAMLAGYAHLYQCRAETG
jgi:hypothetical protein